jgi:serine/threonine protein kinase
MTMKSHFSSAQQMPKSLVGEQIAQLKLDALLSDGLFAQVYRASSIETGSLSVVKLAVPPNMEAHSLRLAEESQALEEITGALVAATPDPRALLEYQVAIMEENNECCPRFYSWLEDNQRNLFGCSMEFLDGITLQELIVQGTATLDQVIAVAEALQQFLVKSRYHGDLKPSNIMLCDGQAKLLDPGYFGAMKTIHGDNVPMKVTTPLYYPMLKPDDLFAIGLMAWEVVCGTHPLRYDSADITVNISQQLRLFLSTNELYGQFYLSPIVYLSSPERLMPGLSPSFQKIMLRLLRLTLLEDEVLDLDIGYESITEVIDALKTLASV